MSMKGTEVGKLAAKKPAKKEPANEAVPAPRVDETPPKKQPRAKTDDGTASLDAPKPRRKKVVAKTAEPLTKDEVPNAEPVAISSDSTEAKPRFDVQAIVSSPAFLPAVIALAGILLMFWRMIAFLPTLWMGNDGYYSHGFLVPLISGYIVYRAWPRIREREIKPQYWAIIPILGLMYCALVAGVTGMQNIASFTLVAILWGSVVFIAGWQWFRALFFPIGYLLFALPVWSMIIDSYTNPMQIASTKAAFKMLEISGFQPFSPNDNTIYLNNFTLDVGVPCSGLKLILALSAFTVFFVLVARLKWWGTAFMLFFMWPLALFINGLRIAMIGVVGNQWGPEAGAKFHDYSGYITLILCFFILFKIARGLGWKD